MSSSKIIPCDGCTSFCSTRGQNSFRVRRYLREERIAFSPDTNHLFFLTKGEINISGDGCCNSIVCNANQIVLLVQNREYEITATESCELLTLDFISSFQICDGIGLKDIKDILGEYVYEFHTLPFNEYMSELVKSTIMYTDHKSTCKYIHQAKQQELFYVFRMYYPTVEMLQFFSPVINSNSFFQSLVRANYPNAKNVEELARLCGYGVHNFKKVFSYNFNESPYQWMLRQSVALIRARLLDGNIPIKVIVEEFGFSSQSHLNLFCKRHFGATSSQVRKEGGSSRKANK